MRFLLLLALAPAALALYCPSNCYCELYDELEYRCKSGSNKVTYNARNNEYVNIECEGANLTCADFPQVNFANNQTLPSLWLKKCPPSIIPCLNDALMTSSISFVTFTKLRAPMRADDVEHLGEVQEIMISEGPKDPLPPSALEKLPTLRRLRITSTPVTLDLSTFAQSPGLEYLELSDPLITEIPSGMFASLHKLKMLNFWGNSLSDVEVDSLLGLDSLEKLSFTMSRLANISPGAFKHLPKLKSLYIMKNRIEEIAPGLLTNLTQLENITIQLNDIKLHLHSNSITNLPGLKNLIIKDCFAELPKDLITGCEALRTLDLSQNRITAIPDNFFKDLKNLEHLDLSYNRIAKLDSGVLSPLKQLKYLNLDRNHLEVLPEFFFAGLRKLEELSINENLLTTINALAFQGATSLQTISMMGNKLQLKSQEQIESAYNMGYEVYSPFNTLIELKKLTLSRNNITTIFDDWRIVFTNLEVLDLSHNRIENLNPVNYQFLSKKVTVDLQYNNISTVGMYQPAVSIDHSESEIQSNTIFLLDHNPFNCDCHIYNFVMRLRGKKPASEPNFNVGDAECKSPDHLNGDLLRNVSPSHLLCEEMLPEVRFNCNSVLVRPEFNDLSYDCDYLPPSFPDLAEYGVQELRLKLKHPPKDLSNLSLSLLNLTNIGLQKIPFEPSKLVKVIDFSNNSLTKIPVRFVKSNTTLYLSHNPFDCGCFSKDDIVALKGRRSIVKDYESVGCSDGVLVKELDIPALCYTQTLVAEIGGIFVFLLILFILAFIFSRQIVDYCGHRLLPCWYIDDPDNIVKAYDIFVSYAHQDQKYVDKLLPKLENDFKLKVCVHYRDWEVGDFIPDQIHRSVSNSRKTIILLSNHFLDSTFANMEFRTAHNLALKEGRERVILILLEDVSKHEKLSEELKYHMKMNTYLTWDDIRFDDKLKRRTIPQKYNKKKFVAPAILKPIFRQATENNLKKALDVHLNSSGQLVNMAQNKKNIESV